MITQEQHQELLDLLTKAGFVDGYALAGDKLILWQHQENPPAPLTRPETDETLTS
jgi:hypothetical protein